MRYRKSCRQDLSPNINYSEKSSLLIRLSCLILSSTIERGIKKKTHPLQEGIKSLFLAICSYHSSTSNLNILPLFLFLSTPVRKQDRVSKIKFAALGQNHLKKKSRILISAEIVTEEKPTWGSKSSLVAGGQMKFFQDYFHLYVHLETNSTII